MINLKIPDLLCGEVKDLKSVFINLASQVDTSEDEAGCLFNLLPQSLQKAPAFHDQLTKLWRYDFGEPIDQLPSDHVVIGTHMFPPVARLLLVLSVAIKRLSKVKFDNYIQRLSDPAKHQDVLAEISPMLGVDLSITCDFEVSGYGVGNRTIDWLLHPPGSTPVLFDVKCRMKDLIEGLANIVMGHRGSDGHGPAPVHNVSILFKDTEGKFITNNPNEILQGVWIISQLQQERSELHVAFDSTDPMKLHFVVLANWGQDAYVLIRNGIAMKSVTKLFNVIHSDRFVFDRLIGSDSQLKS